MGKTRFNWDSCIRDKSQTDSMKLLGEGNQMLNVVLQTKSSVLKLNICKYTSVHVNK